MTGYTDSHASGDSSRTYLTYMSKGLPRRLWEHVETPLLREVVARRCPARGTRTRLLLDLACGNGRAGSALLGPDTTVVGADFSVAQMSAAVADGMVFTRADAGRLGLRDGAFDAVIALRFFANAEDPLRTASLRESHRVLAPGGVLVCNVHNIPRTVPNLARQLVRVARRGSHPRWISRTAIEQQFRDAGFTIAERISYGQIGAMPASRRLTWLLGPLMGHDLYVLAADAPA